MGKQESRIEKRLCDGIKAIGGKAYKLVSPGNNGMPDRLVCLQGGRVVFVELKSPKGVISNLQAFRIAELRRIGQSVVILRSAEDVEEFLAKIRGEISHDIHTA